MVRPGNARHAVCVAEAWAQALGNNRLLRRPAWLRDSEFFTASPAVPLPARRVLHTGRPKDETRLGPDFSKSKTFCNFVLHYTTFGVVRGGAASCASTVRWVWRQAPVCERVKPPHGSVPSQSRAVWRRARWSIGKHHSPNTPNLRSGRRATRCATKP